MEIKRGTELVLCEYLKGLVPEVLFLSSKGGSDSEDIDYPNPPFAVVIAEPAEKTLSYEDTNLIRCSVIWVTQWHLTDVNIHTQTFKKIYDALSGITSYIYDQDRGIMIHGIDISGTDEFSDNERSAHGDTIDFVAGVTSKRTQL